MRYVFAALGVLALLGLVGAIKGCQIATLIAAGKAMEREGPPPEVVNTAPATEQEWEQQLFAVGTVEALRGVAVSSETPGLVTAIHFKSGAVAKPRMIGCPLVIVAGLADIGLDGAADGDRLGMPSLESNAGCHDHRDEDGDHHDQDPLIALASSSPPRALAALRLLGLLIAMAPSHDQMWSRSAGISRCMAARHPT